MFFQYINRRTVVLGIVAVGIMIFIFFMSSLAWDDSDALSIQFVKLMDVFVSQISAMTGMTPDGARALLDLLLRKAAHFTEFAVMGGFVAAMLYSARVRLRKGFAVAILCCLLYAISDELHQYFISERTAALLDVGIDSLGALIGIGLITLIKRRRDRDGYGLKADVAFDQENKI